MGMAQDRIYSPWRGIKRPCFCITDKVMITLSCSTAFLCFCFLKKFLWWNLLFEIWGKSRKLRLFLKNKQEAGDEARGRGWSIPRKALQSPAWFQQILLVLLFNDEGASAQPERCQVTSSKLHRFEVGKEVGFKPILCDNRPHHSFPTLRCLFREWADNTRGELHRDECFLPCRTYFNFTFISLFMAVLGPRCCVRDTLLLWGSGFSLQSMSSRAHGIQQLRHVVSRARAQ